MVVPKSKSAMFWKLYNEFEAQRKVLEKIRIDLISVHATNYAGITNEKADKIAKASSKNKLEYPKKFCKFYGKYKKAVRALKAV
jgi:hypothetical protein